MNKRINEAINNKFDNYILPFLWLHGESKERVKEEIIAIKNSDIRYDDIYDLCGLKQDLRYKDYYGTATYQ